MNSASASDYNIAFGKFMREKRKEKGISQKELASILGKSQAHICNLEKGKRNPDLAQMIIFFREIGTNPMDFFSQYL